MLETLLHCTVLTNRIENNEKGKRATCNTCVLDSKFCTGISLDSLNKPFVTLYVFLPS